jgi:TatD DNase family protein
LQFAHKYEHVFASVGVHPSDVKEVTSAQRLLQLAADPKVIGFGETGLDYFYNQDEGQQQMQRDSFTQHIIASQQSNKPVIVHSRDAEADTIAMITDNFKQQAFPILIHCFTGSKDFAERMLDLGGYISISGIVTFKNATQLQDVVRYVPLENILIETDSPYLAPVPKRGKMNEPAYVTYVAEFIAQLKNLPLDQVQQTTTQNFLKLFQLQNLG